MIDNFDDLTVIILTYKTKLNILEKCISSIDPTIKVLIIENSKFFLNREYILKKYKNASIFCTESNLGYGNGNNYGINKVHTNYVLILNPDTECAPNYFENIKLYINNKLNFSIIGSQYTEDNSFAPAGFFDETKKLKDAEFNKDTSLYKVDWVVGCALLLNLKSFENKNIFDENFFLFFEEFDLCKNLKQKGKLVYSSEKLLINHYGFKSSTENTKEIDLIKLRSWHYMWSFFYYHRKNNGYFSALKNSIGKLLRSFFKMIFYSLTNKTKNKILYKYRFLGVINSILGKKSWFRIDQ